MNRYAMLVGSVPVPPSSTCNSVATEAPVVVAAGGTGAKGTGMGVTGCGAGSGLGVGLHFGMDIPPQAIAKMM